MDCSEIGPSLPTYREAEPSTETFHADVGGLSTQVAPTLSLGQPPNAPLVAAGFAPGQCRP